MNKLRRIIVYLLITPIYWWGCLFYKKEYLKGQLFLRDHFSLGWKWIIKYWYCNKVKGINKGATFPIPPTVMVGNFENIHFDVDDMRNFHSNGCYYQGINAQIYIGRGTLIAPNCGFITANHDLYDLDKSSDGKDIIIGENCWIGMNSVILPGVILGNHTIVGAGSIVTKSFENGNCVIVGNPAKKIRDL